MRKIAYFLLRTEEENDQLYGGTWSNLFTISRISSFTPVVIVNEEDVLLRVLSDRKIQHVTIKGKYPLVHTRKNLFKAFSAFFKLIEYNYKIFRFCLGDQSIAIVQCDDRAALMIFLGAKLAGKKLVIAVRNYKNFVSTIKTIFKIPMMLADGIVATSDALLRSVQSQISSSAKNFHCCIYNAIDLSEVADAKRNSDKREARRDLGIQEGEVAIGLVGAIVPFKGQAAFIQDCMSGMKDQMEKLNAKIYFLGGIKDEGYGELCSHAVKSNNLDNLTKFCGYTEKIYQWYRALDFVIYPGIEGIARVLIEAQAFGLPVIAFEGCREVVVHNKSGFLCRDFSDMRNAIIALSENATGREEMGRFGETFIREKFAIENNVRRYEDFYQKIIPRENENS
ncbi:MAG: glycosyltransferase family 4 protein [Deltaproteobacteria bacterium]|nr:glycosyltransferase family 4 protein [Deltaproteobacteria bacterium]